MPHNFILQFTTIDKLIQKKATGTPSQLANRIGVSRRTVIEYIKVMRSLGAPIYYSKSRNSYCYEGQGYFNISFIRVQ